MKKIVLLQNQSRLYMRRLALSIVFVLSIVIYFAQIQRLDAWLRADSATLGAPSWIDVSGGGLSDLCRAVNPTADYDYPEILPHRHMGDSIPINPGDIPSPPLFVNPYFIECGDSMPALGRKCAEGEKHIERLFQGCQDMLVRATHPLDSLAGWRVLRHECEPDCYWYHTDHLGSSSWITHTNGQAVQHLHYLPWGEGFVDQRATDHAARYTFSAKEKDSESGLYYYGARYYDPDLGIWLSVDPMASKYPSFSPYAFCGDNPVKFVDLEGEEIVIEWKGSQYRYEKDGTLTHFKGGILNERQQNRFVNKAKNALDKINKTTEGNRMISDLQESDTRYTIKAGASGYEKTEANTITWNPNGTRLPVEGTPFGESNSTCDLAHELSHAFDDNNNWTDNTSVGDLNKNEWVACYRENHIRKESGYGYRTHYISGFTKDGHFQGGEGSTLLNDNGPYLPFDIKSYEKRK